MQRTVFIFAVLLVAVMLYWRTSLYEDHHVSLSDRHGGAGRAVSAGLPPSGFKPGHLLRDTLKNDELHTPPYLDIGRHAYRQYLGAPAGVRARIDANLTQIRQPAPEWIASLDRQGLDFVCIGESHQQNYREFLARHFFPVYGVDTLFLEARLLPAQLMHVRADVGEQGVDLLSADIAEIIRAASARNPEIEFVGIEESRGQLSDRREERSGSRDHSLFENVTTAYRPGTRSAALLGALHCTRRWNWLYARLEREDSPLRQGRLLNMRLMSERKDLLSREFSRFLSLLGYPGEDYVVVETDTIDALLHEWFLDLTRHLAKYQAVVVFRDEDGVGGEG